MGSERSLARNTVYSGIAAASNIVLIVLVIIAARILGDKSFGHFSFALALATIFEMFTDLGLNTLTARNVARNRNLSPLYLSNILGWKLILTVVSMGLLVMTVNILQSDAEVRTATYILGGAIVLRSFKGTSHAFFQAHERFDLILLTAYIERITVLVSGIAVLVLTRSLLAFAAVFALVRIPDVAISYWLVHRNIAPVRFGLSSAVVRRLQMSALPFGLYAIVMVTYWQVGTVFLSAMRSAEEVGWYNAAYKIYEGLSVFPGLLSAVLLPRLSRLFTEERARHSSLSLRFLRYLILASLPMAVSVAILAPQIIAVLYGREYMAALAPLRGLLAAGVLMFLNNALNTILISADKESSVLKIAGTGLAAVALAYPLLIRQFGVMGAAYSVVAGEACVFAFLLGTVWRVLFPVPVLMVSWRPVVACLSAGAVVQFSTVRAPLAAAAVFVAIYALGLLLLRTFDASEWSAVRTVFSPRSNTPS